MATSQYRVTEHIVPCQHIRGYPHALADSQKDTLHLAVKQYTPFENPNPKPRDVTIIATHANAMPKEVYEPLWEELFTRSKASGFKIRNIWIADMAHPGSSATLNENLLGNDPHWFDHARDLLFMINHSRHEMPRPPIGIGHSLGVVQLIFLSTMHPRLLSSAILIDPYITLRNLPTGVLFSKAATFRRDVWPSREKAEAAILSQPLPEMGTRTAQADAEV